MKLTSLIDEKFGLPGNVGRDFGEMYVKEFINKGDFADLFTKIEKKFPNLQSKLAQTFEKTNNLFKYIKPDAGDETYKVSTLANAEAEVLATDLEKIINAIPVVLGQLDSLDEKGAIEVIEYFDNVFEDMLMVFTSNTSGDEPLKPYKKTNIGFKMNEMDYKSPSEKDAEKLAIKTKQIAAKAGVELVNLAKDIYDTPTIKRLRAYISKEVGKLGNKIIDKYAVDQPGKQIKIPFKDEADLKEDINYKIADKEPKGGVDGVKIGSIKPDIIKGKKVKKFIKVDEKGKEIPMIFYDEDPSDKSKDDKTRFGKGISKSQTYGPSNPAPTYTESKILLKNLI